MKPSIYKKFLSFLKNEKYYPYFVLLLGVVVIFFQLHGSLGTGDEVIYSQVARGDFSEGRMDNSVFL